MRGGGGGGGGGRKEKVAGVVVGGRMNDGLIPERGLRALLLADTLEAPVRAGLEN